MVVDDDEEKRNILDIIEVSNRCGSDKSVNVRTIIMWRMINDQRNPFKQNHLSFPGESLTRMGINRANLDQYFSCFWL